VKVLHVINSLRSGGAEKLLEDLLPRMNGQEGVQIEVLLLTDKGNVFDKGLREAGIPIYVVPLKSVYNPLNVFYLRRHILKNKYDIVHVHLFPASYWVALAARSILTARPKLIFTEHSTHNRRRTKRYLKNIEKLVYSTYHKVVSVSSQVQENLIDWLNPNDKSKFIVIENGTDVEKFSLAKPYMKNEICNTFSDNTKLVCMVGRFTEAKDQVTLIKAIAKLPENVHLLLIGDGPLREENEMLCENIGVSERVHFLGFREDVPRILKTIDVVVLSSKWEGLPLSLIEAMAAGKPVIGSNVQGIVDVLRNKEMVFQMGDSSELAKKIFSLLDDKNTCNILLEENAKKVAAYSVKYTASRYLDLYKELVNNDLTP